MTDPARQSDARRRHRRGFTLIEVIVVVLIIGVLATLIIPQFFSRVGQARQSVAKQKLATIEQAIQMFRYDYGRLPRNLEALVNRPSDIAPSEWNQPSIEQEDLIDPWGNQFRYDVPGDNGPFDLYSYGKDNQPGGEDQNADVTNWSESQ